MALTDIEAARVRKALGAFIERRRPPPHLREEVDLTFRLAGQSVEIIEIRRSYAGSPGEKIEYPVAKATYVRSSRSWRVFWLRQDMKWHSYQSLPVVSSIDEFVALVNEDRDGCFFG